MRGQTRESVRPDDGPRRFAAGTASGGAGVSVRPDGAGSLSTAPLEPRGAGAEDEIRTDRRCPQRVAGAASGCTSPPLRVEHATGRVLAQQLDVGPGGRRRRTATSRRAGFGLGIAPTRRALPARRSGSRPGECGPVCSARRAPGELRGGFPSRPSAAGRAARDAGAAEHVVAIALDALVPQRAPSDCQIGVLAGQTA